MFRFSKFKVYTKDILQSVLVGASDGITVPLTILCGLTSAGFGNPMLVTVGVIVSIAGAVTMGIGAYVTEKTELREFQLTYGESDRSAEQVMTTPGDAKDMFRAIGLKGELLEHASADQESEKQRWMELKMQEQPDLFEPDQNRPLRSSVVIFLAYLAGGLFATMPYRVISNPDSALRLSVFLGLNVVFILGYFKFLSRGMSPWKGALRETLITAIAAGSTFLVAKLF